MNIKHLCIMACALLAVALSACNDKVEEPELRAGGVHLLTAAGQEWINGKTFTMLPQQTSLILELGSRGITADSLIVVHTPSPHMKVRLLDPFNPDSLTVYDRIKCQDGDKVWYDNLYKQRIEITDLPMIDIPADAAEDRTITIKVIPVGGYNVYSTFFVTHIMRVNN